MYLAPFCAWSTATFLSQHMQGYPALPLDRRTVSASHSSQFSKELGGLEDKALAWYLARCWSREAAWRKESRGLHRMLTLGGPVEKQGWRVRSGPGAGGGKTELLRRQAVVEKRWRSESQDEAPEGQPMGQANDSKRRRVAERGVASLAAQRIKRLPAVQEARVRSLGWEDPLEKEMATYSSILCLENPMDRKEWRQ